MAGAIAKFTLAVDEQLHIARKDTIPKISTNIPRKGIARPLSPNFQFSNSCVCERFYSHDWSACSAAAKYVDLSFSKNK
jgi:hypothetical protein